MLIASLALAVFAAVTAALVAASADVPWWGILLIYSATGTGVFAVLIAVSQALSRLRQQRRDRRVSITTAKLHLRS